MDITITLKAEPKLLKAIDALVECLQAQGTLATTLSTFELQTGNTVEPLPEMQHPINLMAERIGNITRILHPQATGASIHEMGPIDDYLNNVMLGFLQARGLVKITDLSAAEDLDALLYTLQGAAAQRTAAQQALSAPTFPVPAAPTYQQPVYQTPVAPPVQVYQAPIAPVAPPAPVSPLPTAAPTYSMDQLAVAATGLVDVGKVGELMSLLGQYGCQALTQLPVEQYGNFATALRGLGAQI
jgi:hypothetical protein